ncbi:MAG: TMEM175 family protein [Pseudomonadota bacterium]
MRGAIKDTTKGEAHFVWRSPDVSRIENLSDIIFALALALIATPLVPTTFAELKSIWRDILATGFCFAIMLVIWNTHYVFFRRYDLMDGKTVFLNSVLLFLIFSLAYPLKFIMSFVVRFATFDFSEAVPVESVMTLEEGRLAMIFYSLAYASIFIVFAMLYGHARSQAESMQLSPQERVLTQSAINGARVHIVIAIAVVIGALLSPSRIAVLLGGVYFLIWPCAAIVDWREKRALKRLEA